MAAGQLYHFQADGPVDPDRGHRFDPRARLIDPYAKALAGNFLPADDGIIRPPKCVVVDDEFDWQEDRHLRRQLSETIIYEMHVRGFTPVAHQRREPPRHVPGRDREDSLSAVAGRDGGRADAGPRVPDQRLPRASCRAAELLGLRPAGLLRPAPRLRRRRRAGLPGPRVQGDGPGPAPRRDRGDPRRGLQPHGRRQRERARRSASRGWRTASTTCSTTAAATTATTPAAATRSTATTRSSAS